MWRHFICLPLLLVAAHGCGEVSPRAEVVCYNNGDAHLSSLDPCKCTILAATNLDLDADLRLTSTSDFTKLQELKKTNPELKLVGSLGGPNVKAETFSLVTSSVDGVANFTEGLVSFVNTNGLDGIEIDWRWPGQLGGSKEIDDVSTLMKVVRLALDQRVHSVSRRDAEETTTVIPEEEITTTDVPETVATDTTETTVATTEKTATTEENTTEVTEPELLTEASTEASTTEDVTEVFDEFYTESPDAAVSGSFLDYVGSFFGDYFSGFFSEDYPSDYAEYYEDYDYAEVSATTFRPEIENLGSDYLVLESGSEYEVTVRPTQPEVRPKAKVYRTKEKEEEEGQGVVSESESESSSKVKPYRGRVKFSDYFKLSEIPGSVPVPSSTTPSPLATTLRPKTASSGGWKFAKGNKAGDRPGPSRGLLRRRPSVRKTPQTILMMTLAPYPEYIVKGYDLKALSKIVDLFSLPTHNLTEKTVENQPLETYHHSRLMGVSDLQNADSIVDLVVSLGVPLDRLILGLPSTAALFKLEDAELNTPRSPAVAAPEFTSYRKACTMMETGNWTVERDEDLTGPYAFLNDTWIAFDDPTSIKIKVGRQPHWMTTSTLY